jgi:hypothetical protein
MRFWLREVAGWVLIVLGLYVFARCYMLLTDGQHYILEAGTLTVIGIFLFRGGIHLLKIAVAAEVCLEAEDRLKERPAVNRGTFVAAKRF